MGKKKAAAGIGNEANQRNYSARQTYKAVSTDVKQRKKRRKIWRENNKFRRTELVGVCAIISGTEHQNFRGPFGTLKAIPTDGWTTDDGSLRR